jgi:uncharacterized membrane protein YebE (DUF533 family)
MALPDRLAPICDLLLGAAYADEVFKDREREEVRGMLEDLSGGKLTSELESQIAKFDPKKFDLAKTAAAFKSDSADDKRRLLFLVAAINEADDEIDFAEDQYLRDLCKALQLPDSALEGLTIDIEVEEMRDEFEKVRRGPPPTPGKGGSVDVDLD